MELFSIRLLLYLVLLVLGTAVAHGADPEVPEYPSDSFARPTVDAIPIFENFCGVTAGISSPLAQEQKFKTHRLEQIDWQGGKATEWEFQAKPGIPPPAILSFSEKFYQLPKGASITITNLGKADIEVALHIREIPWWTDTKRVSKTTVAFGTPKIEPGLSQRVNFFFDTTGFHGPLSLALSLRNPDQSQVYHLVLSNLTMVYAAEVDVAKAKLVFTTPVVAGLPVKVTVSGTGFHAQDHLTIQLADGRWVL
jgi:hypothetical protein